MIPPMFARSAEEEIWVLCICADYLEDKGKDGSLLRFIADNHFLLDDSGFCDYTNNVWGDNYGNGYGYGPYYNTGDGSGDSTGMKFFFNLGDGYGSFCFGYYCYGDIFGGGKSNTI